MDCSSSSSSDDDCATVLKEKEDDQENAWSCCLIPKYVLKLLGVSIYRNLLAGNFLVLTILVLILILSLSFSPLLSSPLFSLFF